MGLFIFSSKAFLQLVKFVISGVVSAIIEIGLYIALVDGAQLDYLKANILVFIVVCPVNFLLNKYWVFDRGALNSYVQIVSFVLLALLNLGLNQFFLWSFVEYFFINDKIAKVLAIGICVLLNFIIKKYFIFEKKKDTSIVYTIV